MLKQKRPRYLNLLQIHLPLAGFVSILHRISGVLLIISLPFALLALDCSTRSEEGYHAVLKAAAHPLWRLAIWAAVWAWLHHLCAGIRFILLDCHIGVSLPAARTSALLALIVSTILTLLFGVWLWL